MKYYTYIIPYAENIVKIFNKLNILYFPELRFFAVWIFGAEIMLLALILFIKTVRSYKSSHGRFYSAFYTVKFAF